METAVLMERNLFNCTIRQNSKTGMISVNDMLIAGNHWRAVNKMPAFNFSSWYQTQATKEFIAELEKQFGEVVYTKRGNSGSRWFHPYLFIDLALSISPKLKIEVYAWLYDELLKHRNYSGDSYKKMCGALFTNTKSKTTFPRDIMKLAEYIKIQIGVKDWQTATENQLRLRDKLQENIALLSEVLKDNNQAIRIATHKTLNEK